MLKILFSILKATADLHSKESLMKKKFRFMYRLMIPLKSLEIKVVNRLKP